MPSNASCSSIPSQTTVISVSCLIHRLRIPRRLFALISLSPCASETLHRYFNASSCQFSGRPKVQTMWCMYCHLCANHKDQTPVTFPMSCLYCMYSIASFTEKSTFFFLNLMKFYIISIILQQLIFHNMFKGYLEHFLNMFIRQ